MEVQSLQYHIVQRQRSADWEQHKLAGGEVFLQLMEDGLRLLYRLPEKGSLCGLDEIRFTRNLSPAGKLAQFRHFIPESLLSEAQFERITLALDPRTFTLIPQALFSTDAAGELLQLVGDVDETDVILNEKAGDDMVLVFSVSKEWTDWAAGIFQPAEVRWTCLFSGMLHHMAAAGPEQNEMLAHVGPGRLHAMARKEGAFCFFNRYDFKTEQDLLYFFLLSMEQAGLNPEHDPVTLCGSIMSGSAGFEKLNRYAGNLQYAVSPEPDSLLPPAAGIRHPVYFDLLSLLN
jgi:hypothetical protein